MTTHEITTYQFNELSESAQQNALERYYDYNVCDDLQWADYCYDTFNEICSILGITVDTRTIKPMNGKTRQEPNYQWSGFSSQGDGFSFTGTWSYQKGSTKKIRAAFPTYTELHTIADLQAAGLLLDKYTHEAYDRDEPELATELSITKQLLDKGIDLTMDAIMSLPF
jgi:hypothetical protein